jgi:hypothetical protein
MSNIVLFLVCLCAGLVVSRRRFLPPEVPIVLDRSISFDALPGLLLLQCHDRHLRAAQAVPVAGTSCEAMSGRRLPGTV